MKFSTIVSGLAAVSSVTAFPLWNSKRDNVTEAVHNKTILLTNDDGWAATNIRATYRELKAAGYEVILVSPVSQRSGFGGQFGLPPTVNLTTDGGFAYPPKGAPSWGHEDDDMNVWYFNGTPSSCVSFALNYVIPTHFDNKTIDLVVAGPNEGTNLSPGLFTLSGTMSATYYSVYRGLPAIAFSGSNTNNSFFKDDAGKENDDKFPPNIYAKKVVEFVENLFESAVNHPNVLPLTTGMNVNFPAVGSQDEDCLDPEWVYSRLTGPDAVTPDMTFNKTLGLFDWLYSKFLATELCRNGDCTLPSESWLLFDQKCKTSVSLFSIDYDAPLDASKRVEKYLSSIFN